MSNNLTEDQLFDLSDEELESAVADINTQEEDSTDIDEMDDSTDVPTTEDESKDIDLEQPNTDSDDDTPTEETEKEEVTKESESEKEFIDEETLEEEEQPEETKPETEEPVEKADVKLDSFMDTKSKVKANGKEYEFSNKEKLENFDKIYAQAMDYTKKTQAIKPWRQTIDALQTAELGHEDVSLMIDVLSGDKDAIAQVLKRTGVDTLDLDLEQGEYTPKNYGRDSTALDVKEVIDSISSDKEYETTSRILSNDWDEASFTKMTSNPSLIEGLHTDVKSGLFDTIQPMAEKLKVLDGVSSTKSDLEYYMQAANQYNLGKVRTEALAEATAKEEALAKQASEEADKVTEVKAKQAKATKTKKSAEKRKAAAPATTNAGTNTKVMDYLDASDDDFDEWYKKVQDSQ